MPQYGVSGDKSRPAAEIPVGQPLKTRLSGLYNHTDPQNFFHPRPCPCFNARINCLKKKP
jgi:hypothetical protein